MSEHDATHYVGDGCDPPHPPVAIRRVWTSDYIVGERPGSEHHDQSTWLAIIEAARRMLVASRTRVDWDTLVLKTELLDEPGSSLNGWRRVQITVETEGE